MGNDKEKVISTVIETLDSVKFALETAAGESKDNGESLVLLEMAARLLCEGSELLKSYLRIMTNE